MWQIKFSQTAEHQLQFFDKKVVKFILNWLEERILVSPNPRLWGSGLTVPKVNGLWRYRIGMYRLICELGADTLVVRKIKLARRRQLME